jgi:hypothetical protein
MTGALLVLLLVALVALSLAGIIDAAIQPEQAYRIAGVSKPLTSGLIILTCAVGAAYYFAVVRPQLLRAQRR